MSLIGHCVKTEHITLEGGASASVSYYEHQRVNKKGELKKYTSKQIYKHSNGRRGPKKGVIRGVRPSTVLKKKIINNIKLLKDKEKLEQLDTYLNSLIN